MSFSAESPGSVNQKRISGTFYEKLFSLEILVNDVYINNSCIDSNYVTKCRGTNVLFQFLYFPPVTVCEDICSSMLPQPSPVTHIKFKSGKLCLFPLRPMNCPVLPMDFNINISLVKDVQEGTVLKKHVIGKAKTKIDNSFTRLINDSLPTNAIPPSKIMRDSLNLLDECGRKIGNISFFLRLTYHKAAILTKASTGNNQEALLFQGSVDLSLLEKKDTLKPDKQRFEYKYPKPPFPLFYNKQDLKKRCFCPCTRPKIRPKCICNNLIRPT